MKYNFASMREDSKVDKSRPLKIIFIITSIIIGISFVTLTILAMFYYPGGYSFLTDDFSVLGRYKTEALSPIPNTINYLSSILFILATFSSGVILIPFWIKLYFNFDGWRKYVALPGSITGVLASISLIGVGMVQMDVLPLAHGVFAILFFVLNAVAFILFTIAMFASKNYPNGYAYLGMIYILMAFLYVSGVFFTISPLIQKVCVYYFIFWTEIQNIKLFLKNNNNFNLKPVSNVPLQKTIIN